MTSVNIKSENLINLFLGMMRHAKMDFQEYDEFLNIKNQMMKERRKIIKESKDKYNNYINYTHNYLRQTLFQKLDYINKCGVVVDCRLLHEDFIKRNRIFYNYLKITPNIKDGDHCLICLNDFMIHDQKSKCRKCVAITHQDCLTKWQQSNDYCPLCKSDKYSSLIY